MSSLLQTNERLVKDRFRRAQKTTRDRGVPPRPATEWTPEMGARAEALRAELHLTQDELAQRVGYNGNYLSKVLRAEGGRKASMKLRRQLAEVLGTTVEYLHTGDPALRTRNREEQGQYPELELLMRGQEWKEAHEEVRAYILGLANDGGDQPLSEWAVDFRQALKDHRRGRSLAVTRDALGREAEEDVVEDPDSR